MGTLDYEIEFINLELMGSILGYQYRWHQENKNVISKKSIEKFSLLIHFHVLLINFQCKLSGITGKIHTPGRRDKKHSQQLFCHREGVYLRVLCNLGITS